MIEFSHITAGISVLVAVYSLIRVEQSRRQGTDEGLRKWIEAELETLRKKIDVEGSILREKNEIEHLKISILEARLKPLLDSFDKRLADMFHDR